MINLNIWGKWFHYMYARNIKQIPSTFWLIYVLPSSKLCLPLNSGCNFPINISTGLKSNQLALNIYLGIWVEHTNAFFTSAYGYFRNDRKVRVLFSIQIIQFKNSQMGKVCQFIIFLLCHVTSLKYIFVILSWTTN